MCRLMNQLLVCFVTVILFAIEQPVFAQDAEDGSGPVIPEEALEQGGSGYLSSYYAPQASAPDWDAIAQQLLAGCGTPQTDDSIPYPTVVIDLEDFFVIQGKAEWLPPRPGSGADNTILGIDADGDCVRDDIEHYIATLFNHKTQHRVRKYLYEYAQ